jgi:16S rRNA (cytidine1402-2'-O)-methyltransferase
MQHYPEAALYVVATPIGNLSDISLRALHVLQLVHAIACEDTRHTQTLLRQYGIDKPLLAVHEHNEAQAAQLVIERLQRGERVAYVSDAGTPAVSDPGARLVAAVRTAGLTILPLPGASSVTTALSVAGISGGSGFVFAGFLPSKAMEREQAVQALQADTRAVVILEAPHRMEALARAMTPLGGRLVTVCRELTKQFEEIATVAAQDLRAAASARAANLHWCCTPAKRHAPRTMATASCSCCWPSCRSKPPSNWPLTSPARRAMSCTKPPCS